MQQNANMNLCTQNDYNCSKILNGSAHVHLNLKKIKQQTIPKNRSRYTKNTWCVKCNKTITALHFVQYDVLWSTEKQY